MKIPLKFVDGRLVVNAIIFSPHYHFGASPIIFIVDTGSDATFISESDALTLQISLNALTLIEVFQMAGAKYKLLQGKEGSLYFKTEENKSLRIEIQTIPLAKSTSKKEQHDSGFPSILGTDFLIKNNISLYFNPKKNLMYLEKEE